MKVSLFVHSLDSNPIVRAKPIADAIAGMGHEIEVLGLLIRGDKVFAPYRDAFDYRTVRTTRHVWSVREGAGRLATMATGDIAYACKPLISSFGPALAYSHHGRRCPLYLDVEDDEVQSKRPQGAVSRLRFLFDGWLSCTSYRHNAPLHNHLNVCSGVTVASEKLRRIYGGRILLHGPEAKSEPCPLDSLEQKQLKEQFKLPPDKRVLLFAGTAQPHKGFDILAKAAIDPFFRQYFHLALAGNPEQEAFREMKSRLGEACSLLGSFDAEAIRQVVCAADLIPVIQAKTVYTESQIPAKLLEAFACGRPVIGSAVGDLPKLITDGPGDPRGWILPQRSVDAFLTVLREAAPDGNSDNLQRRGQSGRRFFKENCSPEAIAGVLRSFKHFAAG